MEAAARRAEALARHCHAPLAARGPRAPRDPRAATPTRSGGVDRRAASGGGAAGGSDSESSSDDDDSDDDFGGAGGAGGPDNGGDPAWGEGFSDAVKWNGWGYADTAFFVSPETGNIELSGRRYQHAFEAARVLPKLREFVEDQLGLGEDARTHRCAAAGCLTRRTPPPQTWPTSTPVAKTCPLRRT